MRKRAKVDANQPEIVAYLIARGCTVQSLAAEGNGCPDLLVGYRGRNYLMEIKNLEGKNTLSEDQLRWAYLWNGQYAVVESAEAAWAVVSGAAE